MLPKPYKTASDLDSGKHRQRVLKSADASLHVEY